MMIVLENVSKVYYKPSGEIRALGQRTARARELHKANWRGGSAQRLLSWGGDTCLS